MRGWDWRKTWRIAGLVLGLALLVWALMRAGREVDWAVLGRSGAGPVVGMLGLTLANLLVTAALFWLITGVFEPLPPVSRARMFDLIASSALVNYLPLGWPGPAARSAYLKLRHGMAVRHSLLVLLIVLALTAALSALAVSVLALRTTWGRGLLALAVLAALSGLAAPAAGKLLRRRITAAWAWPCLKAMDLVLMAGRLWLAFEALGARIGFFEALALAGADMVVSMLAITPNGLGISEWAVGLLAQVLRISSSPLGQAAKLLDRGVSVLVIVPVGLWSLWRLRRAG